MRERSFFMTSHDDSLPTKKSGQHYQREDTTLTLPPLHENQYNSSGNNSSRDKENIDTAKALRQAAGEAVSKKRASAVPKRTRKKKKLEVVMGLERDYTDVDFKFRSLQVHFLPFQLK